MLISAPGLVLARNRLRLRQPEGVSTVPVTPSATAHTKGSYAQLVASTANNYCWLKVGVYGNPTVARSWLVDIAVGAAASEVVLIPNIFAKVFGAGYLTQDNFIIPCYIPAGSRVSARAQSDAASGEAVYVSITGYNADPSRVDGGTAFDALGATTATTLGTAVTPGSSGSKSSYVQLSASTANPYKGLFGIIQQAAAGLYNVLQTDIAIGAGGSEVDIIPNHVSADWDVYLRGSIIPYTPIYIPSGTRISTRMATSGTASAKSIVVYGVR